MRDFIDNLVMAAGNNFKSGYNCCEAIVETFRKEAGVNIDDNAFSSVLRFWRRYWPCARFVRSDGRLRDGHQYAGRPQSAE